MIETLSDIIQVVYFRLTKGKRFFKMRLSITISNFPGGRNRR